MAYITEFNLKIYSHKTKKNLLLCSPVDLSKHNFYTLFGVLKEFSVVFITPYLMYHSVILWNSPSTDAFSEQVKRCPLFLCFDMFIEPKKERMYQKWNMALLANLADLHLWPACSIP